MIDYVSGIFVLECVDDLWGREAEDAAVYLHRTALILASELIRPGFSALVQVSAS